MIQRISEIDTSKENCLDCKFYNGDVKRFDLSSYFDVGERLEKDEISLSSSGDKIAIGNEWIIYADEIWEHGIFIEHTEPELRYQVARLLIYARKIRGITQTELSKQTGITQADISKMERAEGNPSLATISRITTALKCSLAMDLDILSEKEGRLHTITDIYDMTGDERVELIDGIIYDMGYPGVMHAMIISYLHNKFADYIEDKAGACHVMQNVGLIFEDSIHNYFVPDLMVICDRSKIGTHMVTGPADLIVEVVSPSNPNHDYRTKLAKYMEMGVREYWIVDPGREKIVVYAECDDYIPAIYPIANSPAVDVDIPVGIYDGDLVIEVQGIKSIIDEFAKSDI